MYILSFIQGNSQHLIGIFESLEAGREWVQQIPGYERHDYDFEGVPQTEELIFEDKLPEYLEIPCGDTLIPISKWMFDDEPYSMIDIAWIELPKLDANEPGLLEGNTRVDAYSIPNDKLKNYIEMRKHNYERVKEYLESQNYRVKREFRGTQDGEAILYRKRKRDSDWHFLMHMDPIFTEQFPESDEEMIQMIQKELIE